MNISKKLAEQIVNAVYEVVKHDANLIGPSGIIIGSTDKKRIGTFHAAGAYAIEHSQPVFVDSAHPFQGAKDGINYPIFLDHSVIAAIGITGSPEELKTLGFLVTKITEVFLKEQQLNQSILSRNHALHYLITSLIYDNISDQRRIDSLLEEFKIDQSERFAVLSVKLNDSSLEQPLRFYFHSIRCGLSAYLYPNEWVVIFDTAAFQRFHADEFVSQFRGQIAAGLGSFGTLYQVGNSYRDAKIAGKHARIHKTEFCDIQDISVEFLLESIPADIRNIFSQRILKSLSEKEILILNVYLSNNLSLKDTAASLFIHKNTLQYQLDRITEKSGLNPRNFQNAFLLQLALSLHEDISSK